MAFRLPFTRKKEKRDRMLDETNSSAIMVSLLGDNSNRKVTADEAMSIPSFAACVNYISSVIASLPIKLCEEKETINEFGEKISTIEEIKDDNRVTLLNGETGDLLTAYQMKSALIRDYLVYGAGFIYINKKLNTPVSLNYVDKKRINTIKKNTDAIFKTASVMIDGATYREFEFIRLLRHSVDGITGKGVADENSLILNVAYTSLRFELNGVGNGGAKKGFLVSERKLEPEAFEKLKKAWEETYSNNKNKVMVLNEGLKYQEASATATEMQMYEQKEANGKEICKLFNLSPEIISGQANEDAQASAVRAAIMPIVIDMQSVLNRDLLLESEKKTKYFVVDMTELTKGDLLKRYRAYQMGISANFIQPDEVRYKEDMAPLGLDFVKLGLNDVLYNPKTKQVYTPNTNQTKDISERALILSEICDIIEERKKTNYIQGKDGKMNGSYPLDNNGGSDIIKEPSPTGANELDVKGFGSKQRLNNHWMNGRTHKDEYIKDGILTKEQYEKRAVELLESPVGSNILGHIDKENHIIRYDKQKNDFVKGSISKGVNTMFKPKDEYDYYDKMREEDIKNGGKT